MELQLVSKSIATLAKELGFNEICHNIFIKDLNNISSIRKISIVGMRNEEVQLESLICTIPEQELLAKWLREEKSIRVEVLYRGDFSDYVWKIINLEDESCDIGYIGYNTHEETMQEALKIALERLK